MACVVRRALPVSEVLGGRPTDPRWTVKRQIPFTSKTWEGLQELARASSEGGQKVGPGQMASWLIEEAMRSSFQPGRRQESTPAPPRAEPIDVSSDDPYDTEWQMPELFSGIAA